MFYWRRPILTSFINLLKSKKAEINFWCSGVVFDIYSFWLSCWCSDWHFYRYNLQIYYFEATCKFWKHHILFFIISCDQAALQIVFSVCPLSHLFFPSSYHDEILGVITNDQSKVHAKGQGQRSKVKVTTQLNHFRTVTQVWIHIWWWNDSYSLMLFRRGALLFFKVIRQISRSCGSKNRRIWPRLDVSGL